MDQLRGASAAGAGDGFGWNERRTSFNDQRTWFPSRRCNLAIRILIRDSTNWPLSTALVWRLRSATSGTGGPNTLRVSSLQFSLLDVRIATFVPTRWFTLRGCGT